MPRYFSSELNSPSYIQINSPFFDSPTFLHIFETGFYYSVNYSKLSPSINTKLVFINIWIIMGIIINWWPPSLSLPAPSHLTPFLSSNSHLLSAFLQSISLHSGGHLLIQDDHSRAYDYWQRSLDKIFHQAIWRFLFLPFFPISILPHSFFHWSRP